MEEKVTLTENCQPQQTEEVLLPEEATTPADGENGFIEVKFNKEIKKLNLEEAATLAQKGMKFDMISAEFELLKELSRSAGMSPAEYLQGIKNEAEEKRLNELTAKCSGDSELALKLLKAEESSLPDEMDALTAEFPEIKGMEDVPEEVKAAAKIKGTGLLFEYLLYEHRQSLAAREELSRRELAERASLGPLSIGSENSAVDAEFLKGIWGK